MTDKDWVPNFEQLIDWVEGRLSYEEALRVAAKVEEGDEPTRTDLAWLRTFLQASQELVSAAPPAELSQRLERRFATYAQSRRRPSRFQRLKASLRFDSHRELALGVRTAAISEGQRQLIFETEGGTVILTLQRRGHAQQVDLLGQLLPTVEAEAELVRVLLLKEGEEFDSTITDDLGEFTLAAVPAGQYGLMLSSGQFEITIPSLELSL